jgi:CheY-like chemotaxis protein
MAKRTYILLAEDDRNDALLVSLAFQKILPGASLEVVSDGFQTLEYLKGSALYSDRSIYPFPDVLLLDLNLPLVDGFEVLRWIRQKPEFNMLPIIALTGSSRAEDTKLASALGANKCMLKSQGFRLLAETVLQIGSTQTYKSAGWLLAG